MPTVQFYINEIRSALGAVVDDTILSDYEIAQMIGYALDKMRDQTQTKAIARGDASSVVGMTTLTVGDVAFDPTYEYYYTTMPGPVYSLPGGSGIDFMAYYRIGLPPNCPPQVARARFYPTTWNELMLLQSDPMMRPSPENPRYIDEDQRIWLFGISPQITKVQMGLRLAFNSLGIKPGDPLTLQPEALFDLRRLVLSMGNWVLLQPNERLLNDGRFKNLGEQTPPPRDPASINDPLITASST